MADWLFLLRLGGVLVWHVDAAMRAVRDKRELTERNLQMLALRRGGKTLREIASTFGVSEVRVFVIIEREEERQEFESAHNFVTVLT